MDRYKILIVDDDEITHVALSQYLNLSGYDMYKAFNGREGLEIMKREKPDLVLLDIQMPEMDGFKTMELLREDPDLKNVQVLFLSALDHSKHKIKGIELGAEDYIVKPFEKAELLARIRGALRRSERYNRFEGMMEGFLSEISLIELLQTMEIGQKTASIRLKEIDTEIFVEKGMVLSARCRNFTGKKAVQRMFFLEKGPYSVTFGTTPPDVENNPVKIQHLVLETITYLDELREILVEVQNDSPLLQLGKSKQISLQLTALKEFFPLPFNELLILMDGELQENARYLITAMKNKNLVAL